MWQNALLVLPHSWYRCTGRAVEVLNREDTLNLDLTRLLDWGQRLKW